MIAGAVVQARMGSSRLPGKSLRPVHGRPLLGRVVDRLRLARELDRIIVATTTAAADDPLAAWCEAEGVACVRGPVDDVLHRIVLAARAASLDLVVRVTGDCPFVCPELVDACVRVLRASGADAVVADRPTLHEGVDPCRAALLERLDAEPLPADEREHLALLLRRRFGALHVAEVAIDPREAPRPGLRLSVDEAADAAFAEALAAALDALPAPFRTADLLRALDERPDLVHLNRHVARAVLPGIR